MWCTPYWTFSCLNLVFVIANTVDPVVLLNCRHEDCRTRTTSTQQPGCVLEGGKAVPVKVTTQLKWNSSRGKIHPSGPSLLHLNKDPGMNEQKKKKQVQQICVFPMQSIICFLRLKVQDNFLISIMIMWLLGGEQPTPKWKIVLCYEVIQCRGDLNNCGNPSFRISPSQQRKGAGAPLRIWLRYLALCHRTGITATWTQTKEQSPRLLSS